VSVSPETGNLLFEDGTVEHYDRLLIATGSEPIVPPVMRQAGAMGFHVMDDYITLSGQLTETKRVVLVGAGLVAMELAASLANKVHQVTVVAPRERVLRNYFDIEGSERIIDLFTASGVSVKLRWGEAVKAERGSETTVLRFSQGNEIEADLVLACLGVEPRIAFVRGSGIAINRGVVVDRRMGTNVPDIFAAGDVAEAFDFLSGESGVNPILPSAAAQGKVAGDNMADKASSYEGSLSMNAFNFFDHLAFSIGKVAASEGDEILGAKRNGSMARLVFTGDVLTGASFLDADVEAGVIQYLIRNKVGIGKHREKLLEAPGEVGYWLMNEAEKSRTMSKEE